MYLPGSYVTEGCNWSSSVRILLKAYACLQQADLNSNVNRNREHNNSFSCYISVAKNLGDGMEEIQPDKTLDCTGLFCPMPVVKTNKEIKGLGAGQVLKMIATDPGSVPDMEAWSNQTGHELLLSKEEGGTYIFFVRKRG
jgi:tRNA 2-thiouridine synthesizing protein A